MGKIRSHVFVEGRVQGVFFRSETREAALRHSVTGWVRNLPDRRVEAVLEGEEADVERMIQWCRQGPPHARVAHVEVLRENHTGEFAAFSIRY